MLLASACGGGGGAGGDAGAGAGPGSDGGVSEPETPVPELPAEPPLPIGPFEIVADAPRGSGFSAASDGDGYLMAWTAFLGRAGTDVVALRLSSRGEPLDAEPFRLSDGATDPYLDGTSAGYKGPGVSFDGTNYGIGLQGSGPVAENIQAPGQVIAFVSVSPDGHVNGPPAVLVTNFSVSSGYSALLEPVVTAGTPAGFYLMYPSFGGGNSTPHVRGGFRFIPAPTGEATVAAESVRMEESPTLSSQSNPSIAAGPGGVVAARIEARIYLSRRDGPEPSIEVDVRARWRSGDRSEDVVLAPASPAVLELVRVGPPESRTAVAAGPDDFLVVWTLRTDEEPHAPKVIHGARTRRTNGVPEADPPLIIAEGDSAMNLGGVAYANERFLVTWTEGGAVLGATVGRSGTISAPFEIDPGPVVETPSVATDGDHFLVLIARPTLVDTVSIDGVFVE